MSPLANNRKYKRSTTPLKVDPAKLEELEPELAKIEHERLKEYCQLLCPGAVGETNIALVKALIDSGHLDINLMVTDEEKK